MADLKLVLAGFGNVGQAVAAQIGSDNPSALVLSITGVSDPRFGSIADPSGLDALQLLEAVQSGGFENLPGHLPDADVFQTIDHSGADILVEVTFTDLDTGEPATSHIRHALSRGLSVSTTNKGPIALHVEELEALAQANEAHLAYEGTVMSGTPTILVARESIASAGFKGSSGILNGTTNYIITRMEEGAGYEEALAEAQDHGYAEADPSGDVDGHDVAAKLSILARALLGLTIAPDAVEATPLKTLTSDDIRSAAASGHRWRYVGTIEGDGAGWRATVAPRRLDAAHPLASISGATNAITFDTESLGEVTVIGPGAGRAETAYSVINDLQRISQGRGS